MILTFLDSLISPFFSKIHFAIMKSWASDWLEMKEDVLGLGSYNTTWTILTSNDSIDEEEDDE